MFWRFDFSKFTAFNEWGHVKPQMKYVEKKYILWSNSLVEFFPNFVMFGFIKAFWEMIVHEMNAMTERVIGRICRGAF